MCDMGDLNVLMYVATYIEHSNQMPRDELHNQQVICLVQIDLLVRLCALGSLIIDHPY